MTLTLFQKVALGVAGLVALGIGAAILSAPKAFFGSYGISLGGDVSLMSELRAPAAGLAAFGLVMLAGLLRPSLGRVSMLTALTVFSAFPAGRILGLILDGRPSDAILWALGVELAVAGLCLMAFRRALWPAPPAGAARKAAQA